MRNKLTILLFLSYFTPIFLYVFESQVVGRRRLKRLKLLGSLEAFGEYFLPYFTGKIH